MPRQASCGNKFTQPFFTFRCQGPESVANLPVADHQGQNQPVKVKPFDKIIFPGLEFSGRLTELVGIPSGLGPAYGSYKDKAFDLKYQILAESKWFPAMAVGVHDFLGTRLFPAEYLVFSRQFFPLDLTLGLGTKRLHGPLSLPLPLLDGFGLFGGIEWAINRRFHLLAEYSPVQYEKFNKFSGYRIIPFRISRLAKH